MAGIHDTSVCARCGFTSSGEFRGDICPGCGLPYWKCAGCGFLITAATPPDVCPECLSRDGFLNVTSYIPDFAGPEAIDPRL
ncbi:MAG: hypothetical protein FJ118_20290 [Deltaproteobacteria bacterium]|nr:hypothetical protein [Deltaproteobacteria bacterium]